MPSLRSPFHLDDVHRCQHRTWRVLLLALVKLSNVVRSRPNSKSNRTYYLSPGLEFFTHISYFYKLIKSQKRSAFNFKFRRSLNWSWTNFRQISVVVRWRICFFINWSNFSQIIWKWRLSLFYGVGMLFNQQCSCSINSPLMCFVLY